MFDFFVLFFLRRKREFFQAVKWRLHKSCGNIDWQKGRGWEITYRWNRLEMKIQVLSIVLSDDVIVASTVFWILVFGSSTLWCFQVCVGKTKKKQREKFGRNEWMNEWLCVCVCVVVAIVLFCFRVWSWAGLDDLWSMPPMQRSRNEASSLEGRRTFFFERRGWEGGLWKWFLSAFLL